MKTIKLAIVGGLLAGALAVPGISVMADDHGKLHIPPGHMPPPGRCRIWYPGTPPGHQPAPGDCRILSRQLPRGAWLVSRDRIWRYDDRPDYYYHRPYASYGRPDGHDDHRYPPHGVYEGPNYSRKSEIRSDIKDVHEARKNVQENQQQVQKNYSELNIDRAELRSDIRNGVNQKEIRQDRREIREDQQKIAASKKDLRQSENKLNGASHELRDDLRRK